MISLDHINVISLDLFDTLVRVRGFEPRIAFEKSHFILKKGGISISFDQFYNSYRTEVRKYLVQREITGNDYTNDVLLKKMLERLGYSIDIELSREVISAYFNALVPYTVPYQGMEQALKSLKEEKFTLILTSNHSWPHHGFEVLKRVGIEKLLDRVIFSGDVGKAKPHKEIFEKAFDGFSNDEILHVGDNPIADVDGSQNYGTYALWVKSRDHFRDRRRIEPTRRDRLVGEIRDITELPDFFGVNPIEF